MACRPPRWPRSRRESESAGPGRRWRRERSGRSAGRGPLARQSAALPGSLPPLGLEDRPDQIQRDRKDDGGVLLDPDLDQRLEEAKLQGALLGGDHLGRVGQGLRGLELTVGVDDLGALLALGLSLL